MQNLGNSDPGLNLFCVSPLYPEFSATQEATELLKPGGNKNPTAITQWQKEGMYICFYFISSHLQLSLFEQQQQ